MSRRPAAGRHTLVATALLLAWPAVSSPAARPAAPWYESYHAAEAALAAADWSEAVGHLNAALDERPHSSANARTYGMRFVRYFPFLRLATAYHGLGQPEAALSALETELGQREVEASPDDRAALLELRREIQAQLAAATAERRQRVESIVAGGLDAAREHQRGGELEAALAAVARVVAVAPDHPGAQALASRLRVARAERERRAGARMRAEELRLRGERELAAGELGAAAAAFAEALELAPSSELSARLEQTQASLRAELATVELADRHERLQGHLERAAGLEAEGRLEAALVEVETALALAPDDAAAGAHARRLRAAWSRAEEAARTAAKLDGLLLLTADHLAAGEFERALAEANRALGLEPSNRIALSRIAAAYAGLSERLLSPDDSPPLIRLDGLPEGVARLEPATSELRLDGSVYDSSRPRVVVLVNGSESGELTLDERHFEGVWIIDLSWRGELEAGVSTLVVAATDEAGLRTERVVTAAYAAPPVGRMPAAAGIAVALTLSGALILVWRRRSALPATLVATQIATEQGTPSAPAAGALDERYELVERIGIGSTGEVFKARDRLLDAVVALKILRQDYAGDEAAVERLRREVVLTREITHPNLLKIYHLGESGARRYVTMQYVDGPDLAEVIAAEGPLAGERLIAIAGKLAQALAALHARGVLHRDIKPSNVLMTADGEPLITDFGLARLRWAPGITRNGLFLGTPAYASPEQALGADLDERSDIYALGTVIFEMATGHRPFQAASVEKLLSMHVLDPFPDLASRRPDLDPRLGAIVERCVGKKRDARFAGATELARALASLAAPRLRVVDGGRRSGSAMPACGMESVSRATAAARPLDAAG